MGSVRWATIVLARESAAVSAARVSTGVVGSAENRAATIVHICTLNSR